MKFHDIVIYIYISTSGSVVKECLRKSKIVRKKEYFLETFFQRNAKYQTFLSWGPRNFSAKYKFSKPILYAKALKFTGIPTSCIISQLTPSSLLFLTYIEIVTKEVRTIYFCINNLNKILRTTFLRCHRKIFNTHGMFPSCHFLENHNIKGKKHACQQRQHRVALGYPVVSQC